MLDIETIGINSGFVKCDFFSAGSESVLFIFMVFCASVTKL